MIILLFVVIFIFVLFRVGSDSGNTSNTNATPATTLKQENTAKNTVPPIGKELSWDSTADICFALGSFIAGLGASGWIGFYENCTLTFNIRNFTKTYNSIHEKVPSDIIKFLAENPSILTKEAIGNQIFYEIEFKRTFPNDISKTGGDIRIAISNILATAQDSLNQGANKTIELTGKGKHLSFRIESPKYTASKTLWID